MFFYRINANEIVATLLSTIAAILLAWAGWGYWSLVTRRIAFPVSMAVGAWLLCSWRPGLPQSNAGVMPMLKFAAHTYGNFSMNYFSRNLDKVLLGWRHGAHSLGNYSNAYHLFVMPVNQLTIPLTNVAIATLSRLRDDHDKYLRYYLNAISVLAFIGMPLSAMLTLTGKDLILLLLGPQWIMAGQIFTIFGPGIGLMLVYGTHGWLHLSLGRADKWLKWGILSFFVTALLFVAALQWGAKGIAVAYTVSFYLLTGPGLWYAGRPVHLKISSIVMTIWKYYTSALLAGVGCWYLFYSLPSTSHCYAEFNIVFRILVSISLCGVLYLIINIGFYQRITHIKDFLVLFKEMIPGISKK